MPEKREGVAYYFDANSYGVVIEENDLQRYYDDNKMSLFVKEPAKVQVRRILIKDGEKGEAKAKEIHSKLIVNPASFESVAKEFSDDKESAKSGGLLPAFSRGQRDAEFEKTAMYMKKDGEVSDVIKTKSGYEILQRVKRDEVVYKPLREVSGQIKDKLVLNEFKRIFSGDMNKMMSVGTFDKNNFNELVKKSIKNEKISLKINSDDNISNALFRIRDGIPAYFVDGNKGVIVVLGSVESGHWPELSSVKETVSDDYYEKKASESLNAVIKKAAIEAKTKTMGELEKIYGEKYKVEISNTGFVKEEKDEKELRAKGYPIEKMFGLDIIGSTNFYRASEQETSNGYIVKLEEIEKFNESQYLEKKNELKKEAVKLKNMAQLEEFIAFLRKKAKINISK